MNNKSKLRPIENAYTHKFSLTPYDHLNIAIALNRPPKYRFPISEIQQGEKNHTISHFPAFPYVNSLFYFAPQFICHPLTSAQQIPENAAIKIQKLYRGHLVRKKLKNLPPEDLSEKYYPPELETRDQLIYEGKKTVLGEVLKLFIDLEIREVLSECISEISNDYILSESARGIFDVLVQDIVKDYIYMTLLESTCEIQAEEWLKSMIGTTIKEILYEDAPKIGIKLHIKKPKVMKSQIIDHYADNILIPIMIKELIGFLLPLNHPKVKEDLSDDIIVKFLLASLK